MCNPSQCTDCRFNISKGRTCGAIFTEEKEITNGANQIEKNSPECSCHMLNADEFLCIC